MKKPISIVLVNAIAMFTLLSPASPNLSIAYANGPSDLAVSHIANTTSNLIRGLAFSHDDSSLFFSEDGGIGFRQISSTELLNSGTPIPLAQDGMAGFRQSVLSWHSRDAWGGQVVGKNGHHWIYGASNNCSVQGGTCYQSRSSGVHAIDTTDGNAVSGIPLLRANGEGQDGLVRGVTGTPDGKYVYALARKGAANTGINNEYQLFKVDATTNTQIGFGVPVGSVWENITSDNNYVYGLADGAYFKVKIDGDLMTQTRDSPAEILAIESAIPLDLSFANVSGFSIQGRHLLSAIVLDYSCSANAPANQIGLVDVVTGLGKAITVAPGIYPYLPKFGADGAIYAFDLCSSKILQLDPESGQVISQTTSFPNIGVMNGVWPVANISHDNEIYVVGGGKTGGLIAVDTRAKPPVIKIDSIAGSGLQGTYLDAAVGSGTPWPTEVHSLQWYRCTFAVVAGLTALPSASKCMRITGATSANYKVASADAGKYLTALIEAKNSIGTTLQTRATFLAPSLKTPTRVQLPITTGTPKSGSYLTGTVGTWSANPAAKTAVQWYRCESATSASSKAVPSSSRCAAIRGATSTSYKLGASDKGKYVTVQITATNSVGKSVSTSSSMRVYLGPSLLNSPAIFGSARINSRLSASKGTWQAYPSVATSYQWYRCSRPTSARPTNFSSSSGCRAIDGATSSRYVVAAADKGNYISLLVKAVNSAGSKSATTRSAGKVE